MEDRKLKNSRNGLKALLISISAVMAALVAGEMLFRYYQGLYHYTQRDDKLGWKTRAYFSLDRTFRDKTGKPYDVRYRTMQYGFREFGDPLSTRKKIFFLGDSIAMACDVSNDKTYYSIVGKNISAEVFAYGAGAYGALQHYLILGEHIDEIKPDLVVIQFSDTDFADDSIALQTAMNSVNLYPRPYLMDDGQIRFPPTAWWRRAAFASGELPAFVVSKIDRMITVPNQQVLKDIETQGADNPLMRKAAKVMDNIVEMFVKRYQGRIIAFSPTRTAPYYDEFKRICERHGIGFVSAVPEALEAEEKKGVNTRAGDGAHWNETGYSVCGEALTAYIRNSLGWRRGGSTVREGFDVRGRSRVSR